MKVIAGIFFLTFCITGSINAQVQLTGKLHEDSKLLLADYNKGVYKVVYMSDEKKSPILGGLFSLVLPGAGEFYSEEYLKAGIFAGVEILLITTAIVYNNKGDDQTSHFEDYADERWSVVKYAEWLNEYHDKEITIDPNTSLNPWERVNWNELNTNEEGSHTLPPYGTQQYYELIGKYYQYSSGWDDYSGGENNTLTSPNFHYYSGMRGDANDYYNVSSKAVMLIIRKSFLKCP